MLCIGTSYALRGMTASFTSLIPPACSENHGIDGPGVLCEGFEQDRNSTPGIQWTRLPTGPHPTDPLRAIGDPNDDFLVYTTGGGASPLGVGAVPCMNSVGRPNCGPASTQNDWHLHSPFEGPGSGYDMTPGIGAPDGGKAHGGFRSMHMGRHLDASTTLQDTLRFRQVSAIVLDTTGDPSIPGIVPGPSAILDFWHMIAVPDDENFGNGFILDGTSFGGGQVHISLLKSDGDFGGWQRLDPTFNAYESTDQDGVSLCSFDAGDDDSPPLGETFCTGTPLWAEIGDIYGSDPNCLIDTDGNDPVHKDCGDLTSCSGGPGCAEVGSLGFGVWARSAFDLSPFSGRVARLRWIGMVEGGWSFGADPSALEPQTVGLQMFDDDDGWWIDDVTLTDLRQAPLPCGDDLDGDGVSNCDDCDTNDPSIWARPSAVTGLTFALDATSISWLAPATPGGTTVSFDLIRSESPQLFFDRLGPMTACVASDSPTLGASDAAIPGLGESFFYLARPDNACPSKTFGTVGSRSDGVPRTGRFCP